jgi:hypothetical protein
MDLETLDWERVIGNNKERSLKVLGMQCAGVWV